MIHMWQHDQTYVDQR